MPYVAHSHLQCNDVYTRRTVTRVRERNSGIYGFIAVAYLGGGALCEGPPFGRTAVIFVTILGLFLAPFRDKIAATSDQMRFFGRKMN